jgi:LETM1 and EF-hand domain-containing protein 1
MYSGQTQASAEQGELNTQIEALQAVLSSIPEELFHEMELEVHNAEGAATNKQRLEVLKEQQELIEEENEKAKELPSVRDEEDIDDKEERAAAAEGEVAVDEADADVAPDKEAKSEAGTTKARDEAAATELKGETTEKEKVEAARK